MIKRVFNRLFGINNNVAAEPVSINNIIETDVSIVVHDKPTITKMCVYCRQNDHNIHDCLLMNTAIKVMINYCSEHATDITKVRAYLEDIDRRVIYRYVESTKIKYYLSENCADYYDYNCLTNTKISSYIEIIICYLCVLPFHPEIKSMRKHNTVCETKRIVW